MPLADTIASIPQSDTDRIARRLLGNDLVDKYGDVIGARPHTLRDVLRDFALGVAGGPQASEKLKLQVQDQFQKAYDREARAAAAKAKADREQATAVISALKSVAGLPPGHRASIFQETLDQAGIPYSKAAVKFLTDADTLSQLPIDDLMERAANGEVSLGDISAVMGSGINASRWYTDMIRAKRDRVSTGNMILDAETKRIRLQDIQTKMRERQEQAGLRLQAQRERVKSQKLSNALKRQKLNGGGKGTGLFAGIDPTIAAGLLSSAAPAASSTPPPATPAPSSTPPPATPAPINIKSITQVQ